MEEMDKVILKAEPRKIIGKQVNALRREGKLPAVIYGHNFEPTPITLDEKSTTKTLSTLTSTSLVTIDLEGKEHLTLVRDRQRNYVANRLIHIDFQVVSQTEVIRANLSIEIVGTSPAVKDFNGVVVIGLNELEIECLPSDLPDRLTIDISKLEKVGDSVFVRDISFGDKVQILQDPDEMIVMVTAAMEEEVVEAEEGVGEEPEVIEKGKKDEDEEE